MYIYTIYDGEFIKKPLSWGADRDDEPASDEHTPQYWKLKKEAYTIWNSSFIFIFSAIFLWGYCLYKEWS